MRILVGALLLACVASPALADCEARLKAVVSRVDEVKDERDRKLVQYDVKRAGRELREGDEDECNEALDHAESILNAQGR